MLSSGSQAVFGSFGFPGGTVLFGFLACPVWLKAGYKFQVFLCEEQGQSVPAVPKHPSAARELSVLED